MLRVAKNDFYIRKMKEMFAFQWSIVCGVIVLTFLSRSATTSTTQQRGTDEICETLPSEIHLIKGTPIAIIKNS